LRCGTSLFRIDDTLEFDPVFNPAEQRRIKAWEKTKWEAAPLGAGTHMIFLIDVHNKNPFACRKPELMQEGEIAFSTDEPAQSSHRRLEQRPARRYLELASRCEGKSESSKTARPLSLASGRTSEMHLSCPSERGDSSRCFKKNTCGADYRRPDASIALLSRTEGETLKELMDLTGWQ